MKMVKTTLRIDDVAHLRWMAKAKAEGLTVAGLVREAVEAFNPGKDFVPALENRSRDWAYRRPLRAIEVAAIEVPIQQPPIRPVIELPPRTELVCPEHGTEFPRTSEHCLCGAELVQATRTD